MADFIRLPFGLFTVLDAVNVLLHSIGESPATTVSPSPSVDVDQALGALNEADLEVQSIGWHWNREDAYPLTLGAAGSVTLPDQTLRVTQAYASPLDGVGVLDVVQRGASLYDRANHTYSFTAAPTVDLVLRLSWDLLPQVARQYITYLACQKFHARDAARPAVLQVNAQDIERSRLALEQYDDEVSNYNAVNGNVSVVSALYGVGGLRRNRGGY